MDIKLEETKPIICFRTSQFAGFLFYLKWGIILFLLFGFRYDIDYFYELLYQEYFLNYRLHFDINHLIFSSYSPSPSFLEFFEIYLFKEFHILTPVYFFIILKILWFFLQIFVLKYSFYLNSLRVNSGVFNHSIDTIDYDKIFDIEIDSPWFLRLFNKTNILLITNDYSGGSSFLEDTLFNFMGLKNGLKERMRKATDEMEGVSLDLKIIYSVDSKKAQDIVSFINSKKIKDYTSIGEMLS